MRVLPVKRISRDTEQSSALERQSLDLSAAIRVGGHQVAGWVQDATVSGAVNLDERPSLGKWMREPLIHQWDGLMVTTQDRITRDDMHWWAFVGWCLSNTKTVIVLDDPSFDISTEDGRMIAGIKATQAAKYRKAIQDKRLKQTAYYREFNLWAGGTWPFGYRATRVVHNGRPRWRLEVDAYTSSLVREAYDRLVNKGHSVGSICTDWNRREIRTALDYQRHINAMDSREGVKSEVRGTLWETSSLKAVLKKHALLGYATHRGEVRLKDGLPVVWAEPILTKGEFDRLQEVLALRGGSQAGMPRATTPFVGVVFCKCGEPLYSNTSNRILANGSSRHYEYYLCKTRHLKRSCKYATSWPKDLLQSALEDLFLDSVGDLEVTRRVFVPGEDHSADVENLKNALDNLAQAIATAQSSASISTLAAAMDRHAKSLSELQSHPTIPARWVEESTGRTYRQVWIGCDGWAERAEMLRRTGIRLVCAGTARAPRLSLFRPEDLEKRVRDASSGLVESGFERRATQLAVEAASRP